MQITEDLKTYKKWIDYLWKRPHEPTMFL